MVAIGAVQKKGGEWREILALVGVFVDDGNHSEHSFQTGERAWDVSRS